MCWPLATVRYGPCLVRAAVSVFRIQRTLRPEDGLAAMLKGSSVLVKHLLGDSFFRKPHIHVDD
jgi:hypothetical protein